MSVFCSSDVSKEDSEDDNEDSNDDEDDGEDVDKASKRPLQSEPQIYTVLSDFKGQQEGDLSVCVCNICIPTCDKCKCYLLRCI